MPTPDSIARRAATLRPVRLLIDGWRAGRRLGPRRRRAGSRDVAAARADAATRAAARLVVLDMRELGFMDCSGVHAIVEASRRAREDGRRLILLRGTPNVDRMFALTGSSDELEIGDIEPLLHSPGQLHLQFADETLIP